MNTCRGSCDRRSCARRCWRIERTVIGGARAASGAALFVVYTTWAAVFRDPRHPKNPSPPNPSAIIAQVEGSGTAVTEKAFPSIELSADPALPAKSL